MWAEPVSVQWEEKGKGLREHQEERPSESELPQAAVVWFASESTHFLNSYSAFTWCQRNWSTTTTTTRWSGASACLHAQARLGALGMLHRGSRCDRRSLELDPHIYWQTSVGFKFKRKQALSKILLCCRGAGTVSTPHMLNIYQFMCVNLNMH